MQPAIQAARGNNRVGRVASAAAILWAARIWPDSFVVRRRRWPPRDSSSRLAREPNRGSAILRHYYHGLLALLLLIPSATWAADGADLFRTRCGSCHGGDGEGGEHGPAITSRLSARSDVDLRDLIRLGLPGAGMPGVQLASGDADALIAHLRTLRPRSPAPAASAKPSHGGRGVDWPTYNGHASGNRHSELHQITPATVAKLRVAWIHPIPGAQRLETTPLFIDGVMYVTNVNEVHAIDPGTGRLIWQYRRPRSKDLVGDAAGGINRGVAVAGRRLFFVTDNAHIIALDRSSGALLWETEMADSRANYGATSAPLVVPGADGDLVVSGTSGGDEGVRGFLAAYRASDGKEAWRFWTVPAPGEPGSETWKGKAIEHGCATTWLTGVYDSALDLLYWTTGNPCPDYNGDERAGDNLYSNSIVALRPRTGERVWHFQYTPHDLHDWDAVQTPILLDLDWLGTPRKLLAQANRNGYFYLLDRATGAFLRATPLVERLTWAKSIGSDGRPIVNNEAVPTTEGITACPSVEGATNWFSPSFDPQSGLFFVQTLEKCSIYRKAEGEWKAGQSFYNGSTRVPPNDPAQKVLRAIDIRTGKFRWERRQKGAANTWGGVLSTSTGIVFYCDDSGDFTAVDARDGRLLWSFPANAGWKASPMAYTLDDREYIAIAASGYILAFSL